MGKTRPMGGHAPSNPFLERPALEGKAKVQKTESSTASTTTKGAKYQNRKDIKKKVLSGELPNLINPIAAQTSRARAIFAKQRSVDQGEIDKMIRGTEKKRRIRENTENWQWSELNSLDTFSEKEAFLDYLSWKYNVARKHEKYYSKSSQQPDVTLYASHLEDAKDVIEKEGLAINTMADRTEEHNFDGENLDEAGIFADDEIEGVPGIPYGQLATFKTEEWFIAAGYFPESQPVSGPSHARESGDSLNMSSMQKDLAQMEF